MIVKGRLVESVQNKSFFFCKFAGGNKNITQRKGEKSILYHTKIHKTKENINFDMAFNKFVLIFTSIQIVVRIKQIKSIFTFQRLINIGCIKDWIPSQCVGTQSILPNLVNLKTFIQCNILN